MPTGAKTVHFITSNIFREKGFLNMVVPSKTLSDTLTLDVDKKVEKYRFRWLGRWNSYFTTLGVTEDQSGEITRLRNMKQRFGILILRPHKTPTQGDDHWHAPLNQWIASHFPKFQTDIICKKFIGYHAIQHSIEVKDYKSSSNRTLFGPWVYQGNYRWFFRRHSNDVLQIVLLNLLPNSFFSKTKADLKNHFTIFVFLRIKSTRPFLASSLSVYRCDGCCMSVSSNLPHSFEKSLTNKAWRRWCK